MMPMEAIFPRLLIETVMHRPTNLRSTELTPANGAESAKPVDRRGALKLGLACAATTLSGCTPWREYYRNGFKVGPNYRKPLAAVSDNWQDTSDARVKAGPADLRDWWYVFNDPALNQLIFNAFRGNLDVRTAGLRVLESQALRGYAAGNFFAQTQQLNFSYQRNQISHANSTTSFFPFRAIDQYQVGPNFIWELDFWGKFRRQIEAADANLDAAIESYDAMLVQYLAETADAYVQLRTAEQRLQYARENAEIQAGILTIADERLKAGVTNELDSLQARSNLRRTQALIPNLEIVRRVANNRLCVLMGTPPRDLTPELGFNPVIPTAPSDVVLGIPAELLFRRPDVRQAERLVAYQSALIGVAQADFYPHISITGNLNVTAQEFNKLFSTKAVAGSVGPTVAWQILQYGRILNNVRAQDARFQQAATTYQQTVLKANEEAENALITFLKSQEEVTVLRDSVAASSRSVEIVSLEYKVGKSDFNRVFNLQTLLTQEQDRLAVAYSDVARGLISLYRALGGGWQIRLNGPGPFEQQAPLAPPNAPPEPPLIPPVENVPKAPPGAR